MSVTLTLDEVRDLATRCLMAAGADAANAAAVADTVTKAERDGCTSHGLFRIPGFCLSLASGKVDGAAEPTVETLAPGVLRVDNRRGLASRGLEVAMPPLIEAARAQGIAAAALVNSHHHSALWPEVEMIADAGLVGLALTASKSAVAPAGGTKPLFGTDPMAFAWPRPDGRPPLVFDQASSALARGEIMIAERDGHTLPEGIGVDSEGNPTTDPGAILKGAQLAFGGYKGAALALMIELLSGALIGQPTGFEATAQDNNDGGPVTNGELLIAMDPARFGDVDDAAARGEALFAEILKQEGTRLPSDRRFQNRARDPHPGTEVPDALMEKLQGLAGG